MALSLEKWLIQVWGAGDLQDKPGTHLVPEARKLAIINEVVSKASLIGLPASLSCLLNSRAGIETQGV